MPGVNVPTSPNDILKTAVPMAGAAVGGFYGGPAGAMAGQKIGQGLVTGGPDPTAVQSAAPQSSAIDRRISSLQDDPSAQLAQADAALKQMPAEYQQAYGPTIAAARQMDKGGQ